MKSLRKYKKEKEENKPSSPKKEDKCFLELSKRLEVILQHNKQKESSPSKQPKINNIKNNSLKIKNSNLEESNEIYSSISKADNMHSEGKIEEKECNNNKSNLKEVSSKRINIEKLMDSDQFAEKFILFPSTNINYEQNEFPYSKPFDDNILLKDESLFFIFDNNYKYKFLSKDDIQNIKNEKIDLNFGKTPYEVFKGIIRNNMHLKDKASTDLYNALKYFNVFKNRDSMMEIYIPNENNNENENVSNSNNLSQSSTRNHSKCKLDVGENERKCLKIENTNLILKGENNISDVQEKLDDGDDNDDVMDNKTIGKKRKRKIKLEFKKYL